jgi:hypothetical protein
VNQATVESRVEGFPGARAGPAIISRGLEIESVEVVKRKQRTLMDQHVRIYIPERQRHPKAAGAQK